MNGRGDVALNHRPMTINPRIQEAMAVTAGARIIACDLAATLTRIQNNDGDWLASDFGRLDLSYPSHVTFSPDVASKVNCLNAVCDAPIHVASDEGGALRNKACEKYVRKLFELADHCDRLEPSDIRGPVNQRIGSYALHMAAFGFRQAIIRGKMVEMKFEPPSGNWCSMVLPNANDDRAVFRTILEDRRSRLIKWLFPQSDFEILE